ncbi:MAG: hypothetical protein KGM47_06500 [Acidobacteriota bacterium]|nr:hypothetical protein [Acidobacteriota bacterium]
MGILPNPKHEAVAQARARGQGVADSYVAGGYKRNAVAASAFMARPEIKARVAEIQELRNKISIQSEIATSRDIALKLGITKEKIIQQVWDVAQNCLKGVPVFDRSGKQVGTKTDTIGALRALELVGRETFNLFVEKHEVGEAGAFSRLTDSELAKRIEEAVAGLASDPEAARELLAMFTGNEVEQ